MQREAMRCQIQFCEMPLILIDSYKRLSMPSSMLGVHTEACWSAWLEKLACHGVLICFFRVLIALVGRIWLSVYLAVKIMQTWCGVKSYVDIHFFQYDLGKEKEIFILIDMLANINLHLLLSRENYIDVCTGQALETQRKWQIYLLSCKAGESCF